MKKYYLLILLVSVFASQLNAQTIWTGAKMTFSKDNFTNWTLEANQDRITENVWITRGDALGIFNIKVENIYQDFFSPSDTEWAYGTTADIGSLTFTNWEDTVVNPPSMLNRDMVVHLITDDIYIDIKFLSWSRGDGNGNTAGGGFSYERSTDQSLSHDSFSLKPRVKIFPNPSKDFITISELSEESNFQVFNMLGSLVSSGTIGNQESIDITSLQSGVYFLKLDKFLTSKFIKY